MALDEALMIRARRTGQTVLRVYGWATPTLSLGRHQRARGIYRDDLLADRRIQVIRRPTGGRALLHHREVTYSVTAPCPADDSLRDSYREINALLVRALSTLGISVCAANPAVRSAGPTSSPCFAEPARDELTHDGRKLIGSAQWRDRDALLQHGSILIDDDQSLIPELMHDPIAAPPPATLRDALGRAPVMGEVARALFDSVRDFVDPAARPLELEEDLCRDAERIADRYRDDAWTWRR